MLFQDELKRVLNPDRWTEVNRRLLAKMLSEYMYEISSSPISLKLKTASTGMS
jgi:siderophore synthetase component